MSIYPDRLRSRVLLIGTSRYEQHDQLADLPAVCNNLYDLAEVLTKLPTSAFEQQHCRIVDNPDSPKTMMRHIIRASKEADHVLLIYFAGHGILGWASQLHLTVYETDMDQIAGTAVPFEWVRHAIQESPALIRILILDCCFSGRAIGAMSSDSAALEQIAVSGTYIITSTAATRVSRSIPGERHTAFTHELINLLAHGTYAPELPLTVSGLYRPLTAMLARRGLPTPKCSMSDVSGDLVLRLPTLREDSASTNQESSPSTSVVTALPINTPPTSALFERQIPSSHESTQKGNDDSRIRTFYVVLTILALIIFGITIIAALSTDAENVRATGENLSATITIVIALIATTYGFIVYRTKRDIFWRPHPEPREPSTEKGTFDKLSTLVRILWIALLALTSLTLFGAVLVGLFYAFGQVYQGGELIATFITTILFGATLYGCLFLLVRALQCR